MDLKGLTSQQVEESRAKNGSNAIPEAEPTTFLKEFLETFGDPMIKILLAIAALMIIMAIAGLAEPYEPIGTIVAVLIVAFVSAKTNVASDQKYIELKENSEKDKCKAIRDGATNVIEVDEVVQGDLILLQSGDKIPADGVLIHGNIKVDNSALNGEAEECKKTAAEAGFEMPSDITGDTFVDEHSLFRGAVCIDGEGYLDVRQVGLKTMMGKMAEEMNEEEPDSPLKVKLAKLANQISVFGYVSAIVITLIYIVYFIFFAHVVTKTGTDLGAGPSVFFHTTTDWGVADIIGKFVEGISIAIIIVVCAVPEGLPLMISLVLMQNTSKMLDHNVLVRKAVGIETAGSLNVLFSDKTGTITKGKLEVVEFFTADGVVIENDKLASHKKVKELLDISIGKNTQSLFDGNHNVIGGNFTDQALMHFIGEADFNALKDNNDYEVTNYQGFNSANKFSQSRINKLGKTFYKGAPERLLAKATKYLDADGNIKDIDMDKLNAKIDDLANKAMRVLSFGYSEKDMVENQINDDVVIIGLVGIRDDVRPEAKEAIKEVQEAGIQVVMITGDRLETAKAIAKDAGLIKSDSDKALSSAELNQMSDDEVKAIVKDIRVIARALPTDKSRMVRLCQEMNLVVGMTGDGVNDSPALKKADVGFAMGSGTEAAKEAGEIVILDDNFKSIKDAILYGRTIYRNILKFCKFQLVINVAAVLISAFGPFFGIEEPLKVTHLLFVNLVMDGLGAIMLGNEPALEKYMREKPRRRDESIVSKPMAVQIGVMGAWLTIMSFLYFLLPAAGNSVGDVMKDLSKGLICTNLFDCDVDKLKTGYFVLFILSALANGFNVRDEKFGIFKGLNLNPGFLRVMGAIIAVQAVIVNCALIPVAPFQWIGKMFSCKPFGIAGWVIVIIMALTMIPVDLIRKSVSNVSSEN